MEGAGTILNQNGDEAAINHEAVTDFIEYRDPRDMPRPCGVGENSPRPLRLRVLCVTLPTCKRFNPTEMTQQMSDMLQLVVAHIHLQREKRSLKNFSSLLLTLKLPK